MLACQLVSFLRSSLGDDIVVILLDTDSLLYLEDTASRRLAGPLALNKYFTPSYWIRCSWRLRCRDFVSDISVGVGHPSLLVL